MSLPHGGIGCLPPASDPDHSRLYRSRVRARGPACSSCAAPTQATRAGPPSSTRARPRVTSRDAPGLCAIDQRGRFRRLDDGDRRPGGDAPPSRMLRTYWGTGTRRDCRRRCRSARPSAGIFSASARPAVAGTRPRGMKAPGASGGDRAGRRWAWAPMGPPVASDTRPARRGQFPVGVLLSFRVARPRPGDTMVRMARARTGPGRRPTPRRDGRPRGSVDRRRRCCLCRRLFVPAPGRGAGDSAAVRHPMTTRRCRSPAAANLPGRRRLSSRGHV